MSTTDLLLSVLGQPDEHVSMVLRWIDARQNLWAGDSINGKLVHIHTVTSSGAVSGDYGVDVSPDEAAVLADYAAAKGHPQADNIARAWRRTLP